MTSAPKGSQASFTTEGSTAEDYEVGYRRPPPEHRWKKGQSGNPKGRPKCSKSIKAELGEELDAYVTARVGGRAVRMPTRRALAMKLKERALAGDKACMFYCAENDPLLEEERRQAAEVEVGQPSFSLAPEDLEAVMFFLAERARRKEQEEGGDESSAP